MFLSNNGLWDDIPCGYYKDDDHDETEGYTRDFICQHGNICCHSYLSRMGIQMSRIYFPVDINKYK